MRFFAAFGLALINDEDAVVDVLASNLDDIAAPLSSVQN